MSWKRRFRILAQDRLGIDIRRWPDDDPAQHIVQLLRTNRISVVLDVGANDGGFASEVRRHGYTGRIESFEPLRSAYGSLSARAQKDPLWTAWRYAIGAETGSAIINVAGNSGASSSLLPMLDRHASAAPSSRYIGSEEVEIRTLDHLSSELSLAPSDRVFLKIDVQGFEKFVIDGASDIISSGQIVGIQMELSFVPLYGGGTEWRQALDRIRDLGFEINYLRPGFRDRKTGQLLQSDVVAFK